MLLILMRGESKALSAEALYQEVWRKPMSGDNNALKILVSRLRKKLAASGCEITSTRGEGYRLEYHEHQ